MKFRKSWKRFWTLDRRRSDGFTLVELIVVIAILAILAGVGTVGYSAYIKSANKNADKVLVGNIIRAIETGTNSYAFVNDDSFKMGELAYPVGFIALSTTHGAKIITSETEVYNKTEGACKFETITIKVATSSKVKHECPNASYSSKRLDCYTLSEKTITYCSAHTPAEYKPYNSTSDASYVATYAHSGTKKETTTCGVTSYECEGCTWNPETYVTIPAGSSVVANEDALYIRSDKDASKCEAAYANQNGTFGTSNIVEAASGNPLYDSLAAAFGSDLSGLKLSYEGWTSEEGLGYASFYTGAPELMITLKEMTDLLAPLAGNDFTAGKLGLSGTYDSSDEILTGVSDNILAGYNGSQDAFMHAWDNDATMTWDSYGFELGSEQYRENYSAMRAAYNNAFASYLDANGASSYSNAIRNFTKPMIEGYEQIGLPALVCTEAFTNKAESGLQTKLACSDEQFEMIFNLYKKYLSSGACHENGLLMFDVFNTVKDTADVANAYKDMYGVSIYDYYNSYVSEMAAMYTDAQAAAGDGIVIIVMVEDGVLNFQVSPEAANPRND